MMEPILCFTDYSSGFGGQYGVQRDRQDSSAEGWDYQEKLAQHESQKGPYGYVTSLVF